MHTQAQLRRLLHTIKSSSPATTALALHKVRALSKSAASLSKRPLGQTRRLHFLYPSHLSMPCPSVPAAIAKASTEQPTQPQPLPMPWPGSESAASWLSPPTAAGSPLTPSRLHLGVSTVPLRVLPPSRPTSRQGPARFSP